VSDTSTITADIRVPVADSTASRGGTRSLLALDPGLTALGYAVWRYPEARPATLDGYGALLTDWGTHWTRPPEHLPERLRELDVVAYDLTLSAEPSLVIVEAPAIEGRYGDRSRRGGERINALAMRRNAQATGAILAGAQRALAALGNGGRVEEVRARTTRGGKKEATATARLAVGSRVPKASAHCWDAIALGLRVLMDHRRKG